MNCESLIVGGDVNELGMANEEWWNGRLMTGVSTPLSGPRGRHTVVSPDYI